jgi:hypothetical protein
MSFQGVVSEQEVESPRQTDQPVNLGHRRAGAVSRAGADLLPGRERSSACKYLLFTNIKLT